ncbi:MAG: hypothetical protein AAB481_00140 [Patescibacteria group bacterium]
MQKIIGLIGLLVVLVGLVVLGYLSSPPPPAQAVVGELIIDQSVSGSSTLGIITAQKLTDSASSTYFLDPAATGDSLVAAGKVTAGSFAGDGSLLTGISGIPAGLVSFFNLTSCPTGWTELTTARGMYIVGLPLSGTLAGSSGTALTNLESRAVGQHLHSVDPASTSVSISDPGHTHDVSDVRVDATSTGGGWGPHNAVYNLTWSAFLPNPLTASSRTTSITASVDIAAFNSANAGSVAGTNAPYIQLLACQKS